MTGHCAACGQQVTGGRIVTLYSGRGVYKNRPCGHVAPVDV